MPFFEFIRSLSGRRQNVSVRDGHGIELEPLLPDTYHARAMAMGEKARLGENAIFVGISQIEHLEPSDKRILYTDSLQSCFPVIFKYGNGKVSLYHANHADIGDLTGILEDPDLSEIQLFEKGSRINSAKVGGFSGKLNEFYEKKLSRPEILHQKARADDKPESIDYCTTLIYRDQEDGEPTIFVGASAAYGEMADKLDKCLYKDAPVELYGPRFQRVGVNDRPHDPGLQRVIAIVEPQVALRRQESFHYPNQVNNPGEGRWHAFKVNSDKCADFKAKLAQQRGEYPKGDYLKTLILKDFQLKISEATDPDDLNKIVNTLKATKEYEVLATGQGLITKIFSSCGLKTTSSVKAFDEMVKDQKDILNKQPPAQPKMR